MHRDRGPSGLLYRIALAFLCAGGLALAGLALAEAAAARTAPEEPPAAKEMVLSPRPGSTRGVAQLPRGDVLLLDFLQQVADATGAKVAVPAAEPPSTTIRLPRALRSLDLNTARDVLVENGFEIATEGSDGAAGGTVYRVKRGLVAPGSKGRIILPGVGEDAAEDDWIRRAPGAGDPARGPAPRLYALEEGDGGRFLIVIETDSKKDAEDILALLRARRKLR